MPVWQLEVGSFRVYALAGNTVSMSGCSIYALLSVLVHSHLEPSSKISRVLIICVVIDVIIIVLRSTLSLKAIF